MGIKRDLLPPEPGQGPPLPGIVARKIHGRFPEVDKLMMDFFDKGLGFADELRPPIPREVREKYPQLSPPEVRALVRRLQRFYREGLA